MGLPGAGRDGSGLGSAGGFLTSGLAGWWCSGVASESDSSLGGSDGAGFFATSKHKKECNGHKCIIQTVQVHKSRKQLRQNFMPAKKVLQSKDSIKRRGLSTIMLLPKIKLPEGRYCIRNLTQATWRWKYSLGDFFTSFLTGKTGTPFL